MSELTHQRFPLLKLPYLSMKDVVKQMPIIEIYKLSLATRRSRAIVKSMKLKTDCFAVNLCNILTHIKFLPNEINFLPNQISFVPNETDNEYTAHGFYDETDESILKTRARIQETKYIVSDPINECLSMATRLNTLFEWKSFSFSLHVNNKEPEELKHILSEILKLSYTEVLFSGYYMWKNGGFQTNSTIYLEVLDYLMNNVKLDVKLFIQARIPENFNHENAFKFRKIGYSDCSWITMETLKSFRSLGSISLCNVNLDSKTINEFVTYWVNSDVDMMEDVRIRIKHGNSFIREEVLNDLITTVVVENDQDPPIYFIKARKTENRKRILGKLTFWDRISFVGINLETVEASEQYKVQLEILKEKEKEQLTWSW